MIEITGTEPAANALAAQMQEMETTTSSGSTPLLQPGQMPGTNQDKTSTYSQMPGTNQDKTSMYSLPAGH